MIAIAGIMMGSVLIIALEVLDTTIKSEEELSLKLALPVLGVLPKLRAGHLRFPGKRASAFIEPSKIVARSIRRIVPKKGARILMVSAQHGEGTTVVAANLASCFGRQDERVLLVDAQVRSVEDRHALRDLMQAADDETFSLLEQIEASPSLSSALTAPFRFIARAIRKISPKKGARFLAFGAAAGRRTKSAAIALMAWSRRQIGQVLHLGIPGRLGEDPRTLRHLISEEDGTLKGLGEYLSYEADQLDDVVWPTVLPGVECLPRVGQAVIPDLLGSNRMSELLEEASERFSLILVDSPPVLPYVDADYLVQQSDAIVFVVQSRAYRASTLKKAVNRLKASGVPIVGVVLNGVERLYMKGD